MTKLESSQNFALSRRSVELAIKNYQRSLRSESQGFGRDKVIMEFLVPYLLNKDDYWKQVNYLYSLKDEDGHWFTQSRKDPDQIQAQVNRFCAKNHPDFRWNRHFDAAFKKLKREVETYRLRPLDWQSDAAIYEDLPKRDTHAGYLFFETGLKEKGLYRGRLYSMWKAAVEECRVCGHTNYPMVIGIRTQGTGPYSDEGLATYMAKMKTRIVMMVDLRQILVELQFAKPVQQRLSYVKWYAGGKNDNDLTLRLRMHSECGRFPRWVTFDYSKYDASVSDWLIWAAFDIVKSMFISSSLDEALFDAMVRSFIHKDILSYDGIHRSHKGVPSGSMFTQIIDSIVNRLITETYLHKCGIKDYELVTMGDDVIIFSHRRVDPIDASEYYAANFGVVMNYDKVKNDELNGKDPEFLSRYWTSSGPWRHPHILIMKILYPERFRDYRFGDVKPQDIVYSYLLGYPAGMKQLIDVEKFTRDFSLGESVRRLTGKRSYLTGIVGYQVDYLGRSLWKRGMKGNPDSCRP